METMNLPYPLNLLIDAYQASERQYPELDSDRYAGLNHLLGELDERQRDIIQMKYVEKRTWEEIARVYGLTRERVRQLGMKAVNAIGARLEYVEDGYMVASGEMDKRAKARYDVAAVKRRQEVERTREWNLDDLDLSVRTLNCLRRNGVYTVEDMMSTPEADMRKWHGFGVGCLTDIHRAKKKVRGDEESCV